MDRLEKREVSTNSPSAEVLIHPKHPIISFTSDDSVEYGGGGGEPPTMDSSEKLAQLEAKVGKIEVKLDHTPTKLGMWAAVVSTGIVVGGFISFLIPQLFAGHKDSVIAQFESSSTKFVMVMDKLDLTNRRLDQIQKDLGAIRNDLSDMKIESKTHEH